MFKDMEYVYEVYREKSFSKAAQNLYISQPALSAAIKKVESKLKIIIFDRTCNPIKLTSAGQFYIQSIEKVMTIQKDLNDYLEAITNDKKRSINIGTTSYFCAHILPNYLRRFEEQNPTCHFNVMELNVDEMADCLKSKVVDLCICVEAFPHEDFTKKVWYEEKIILAVPSTFEVNHIAESSRMTFEDIRNMNIHKLSAKPVVLNVFKKEPFILLKEGNDMYHRSLQICKNAGFSPNIALHIDQLLTSYHVAYNGLGIAFVRDDIVNRVEPTEKLYFYRIDDINAKRNVFIQHRKSNYQSDLLDKFISFLINDLTHIKYL